MNGSVYVGNQTSLSSGFTRGPNFSYQWKMPVGFYTIYMCTMISGVKKLVYRYNSMHAEKVAIPSGGYAGVYGKDVSSYDGYYGYRDAPYKFRIGSDFVIDQNVTKTTSGGASAWGFSITSTTTKSVTRTRRATAGLATTSHWLFGYEQPGGAMKVFYSY